MLKLMLVEISNIKHDIQYTLIEVESYEDYCEEAIQEIHSKTTLEFLFSGYDSKGNVYIIYKNKAMGNKEISSHIIRID